MQWLEIIRLIVALWPIIEKIIDAIDGDNEKEVARAEAMTALVTVLTEKKVV